VSIRQKCDESLLTKFFLNAEPFLGLLASEKNTKLVENYTEERDDLIWYSAFSDMHIKRMEQEPPEDESVEFKMFELWCDLLSAVYPVLQQRQRDIFSKQTLDEIFTSSDEALVMQSLKVYDSRWRGHLKDMDKNADSGTKFKLRAGARKDEATATRTTEVYAEWHKKFIKIRTERGTKSNLWGKAVMTKKRCQVEMNAAIKNAARKRKEREREKGSVANEGNNTKWVSLMVHPDNFAQV